MGKHWKEKYEEKMKNQPKKMLPRMNLGDGYYIQYNEVANGWGGYHNVSMELYNGEDQLVKRITDRFGYFIDFPGVVHGDWCELLTGGYEERIEFASSVYKFKHGFALFSWTLQPDGRYWADEDGFGAEKDDEVRLYSYINKAGEFVTPFADFKYGKHLETREQFQTRINRFVWNSLPTEGELWVNDAVRRKYANCGVPKEFYGNTVVFPLENETSLAKKMIDFVAEIQDGLNEIRETYKDNQKEAYLADPLDKESYHITLHDLVSYADYQMAKGRIAYTEERALYILNKLKKMDIPPIKMEPVSLYNMNGTSLVLGFQAVSEEDHDNLMMLYEMFQPVVPLEYALTPHVTLSYFRYGKHKVEKLEPLQRLIEKVNDKLHPSFFSLYYKIG